MSRVVNASVKSEGTVNKAANQATNSIADIDWDKPMVCPIDPKLLSECEACQ